MTRWIALLALLSAGGCAWVQDRGADAAQVVNLSVGLSEGLDANVRVTKLVQLGFGGYRGIYWTGLKEGVLDVWEEERTEFGVGPLYVHEVFRARGDELLDIRHPLFGDPGFREVSFDVTHVTDRGFFDVGATLNVVFLGADVAVRPAEIADFATGLFGGDLLQDDSAAPDDDELLRRLAGDDVRVRSNAVRALRRRYGEDFGYRHTTAPHQMPSEQILALERWREYVDARRAGALEGEGAEEKEVFTTEAQRGAEPYGGE